MATLNVVRPFVSSDASANSLQDHLKPIIRPILQSLDAELGAPANDVPSPLTVSVSIAVTEDDFDLVRACRAVIYDRFRNPSEAWDDLDRTHGTVSLMARDKKGHLHGAVQLHLGDDTSKPRNYRSIRIAWLAVAPGPRRTYVQEVLVKACADYVVGEPIGSNLC